MCLNSRAVVALKVTRTQGLGVENNPHSQHLLARFCAPGTTVALMEASPKLRSGFSTGCNFAPHAHWATFQDILPVTPGEGGVDSG